MIDEKLYLDATNEVEGINRISSLWAKSMALSDGNEEKAKYTYINIRVNQLADEINREFYINYISVSDFSKEKNIQEYKIIKMIINGFYIGEIKNNKWYIKRNTSERFKKVQNKEYILLEDFSELQSQKKEEIIKMIRNGFYNGKIIDEKWYVAISEINDNDNDNDNNNKILNLGFKWWKFSGWQGLILGNLYLLTYSDFGIEFSLFFAIINTFLMITILQFNKYSFLIATIISFNPILWIINGIYIKNRWNHPRVNKY